MPKAPSTGPQLCLRASLEYITFRDQGHSPDWHKPRLTVWTATHRDTTSNLSPEVFQPPSLVTGSSYGGPGACAVEHASFCVVQVFPDIFPDEHGQIAVKIIFLHFWAVEKREEKDDQTQEDYKPLNLLKLKVHTLYCLMKIHTH